MGATSTLKTAVNRLLRPLNLKVESTTKDRLEQQRITELVRAGAFLKPQFPLPSCIRDNHSASIFAALGRYRDRLQRMIDARNNEVAFSFANDFYLSPDADVLYTMVREHRPKTIIEIGCGNSTRVMRQAILDGALSRTTLVSIDPEPRREIVGYADEIVQDRVEKCPAETISSRLQDGDFLFIDSSHILSSGGDVRMLFLNVIPRLAAGVIVHIHDIFLPYEYPENWVRGELDARTWNEQYILQAILFYGDHFDVLWPGHYLQRLMGTNFFNYFPFATTPRFATEPCAQSFWMQRKTSPETEVKASAHEPHA